MRYLLLLRLILFTSALDALLALFHELAEPTPEVVQLLVADFGDGRAFAGIKEGLFVRDEHDGPLV